MDLEGLKSYYKLSNIEFQEIQQLINEVYTAQVTPTNEPMAIILGGQPGAGKSELITAAQHLAKNNIVICNADNYRDYHPQSDEIKKEHERFYPEITVDYSQPWNNGLRSYCEEHSLNYILETTFSSGSMMNATIKDIKSKGYQVIIMLLAVNHRFSLLGTYIRYEEMKATDGYGRRVSKEVHDEKYGLIPVTLKTVQEAALYDHIFIYGRRYPDDYGTKSGVRLIESNSEDPLSSYFKERDKPWSSSTIRYYNNSCDSVARMMENRKAYNLVDHFYKNVRL